MAYEHFQCSRKVAALGMQWLQHQDERHFTWAAMPLASSPKAFLSLRLGEAEH